VLGIEQNRIVAPLTAKLKANKDKHDKHVLRAQVKSSKFARATAAGGAAEKADATNHVKPIAMATA
jgi:uncharacterized linocin/CFP29 family protein